MDLGLYHPFYFRDRLLTNILVLWYPFLQKAVFGAGWKSPPAV